MEVPHAKYPNKGLWKQNGLFTSVQYVTLQKVLFCMTIITFISDLALL